MAYLLDTNVLSELRKGSRANAGIRAWHKSARLEETFVSVLVLGEIRRGIELLSQKDFLSATHLERWFDDVIERFSQNILPVTLETAECWGRLCLAQPLPPGDGLQAATALVHDLTLVTRNVRDFERAGVRLVNPFVSS